MDIIKYYTANFQNDLESLMNSTNPKQDRISIVSLVETMSAPEFYGTVQNAFKKIEDKPLFLICYFYSVLLDQAIHSYDRNLHCDFDKIAGYPKFVGILSSYWYNFEPPLILLIALLYIDEKEKFIKNFEIFTKYIFEDYVNFFDCIFPKHTLLLNEKNATHNALNHIFKDIENSLKKENIPITIWDKRLSNNKIEIYYEVIDILQKEVKINLLKLKIHS